MARHTDNLKDRLVHIVHKRLGLTLIELLVKVINLALLTVHRRRNLQSAKVFQFCELFPCYIHSFKHHNRLNELFDAVEPVRLSQVNGVEERHNDLYR